MNMVQQTPDGLWIVRKTGSNDYIDTVAHAASDFGITPPALMGGAIDRTYEPGIRHCQTDGKNVLAGGPLPWTTGDSFIAGITAALAAQLARQPPPTPAGP